MKVLYLHECIKAMRIHKCDCRIERLMSQFCMGKVYLFQSFWQQNGTKEPEVKKYLNEHVKQDSGLSFSLNFLLCN